MPSQLKNFRLETYELPQRRVREVLSARTGTSHDVALREVEIAPAQPRDPRVPHAHRTMEEVVVILSGRGATWIEGTWYRVSAGDAWVVPAPAKHATVNPGPEALRLLRFFPSGAPEDDYHEHHAISLTDWPGAP